MATSVEVMFKLLSWMNDLVDVYISNDASLVSVGSLVLVKSGCRSKVKEVFVGWIDWSIETVVLVSVALSVVSNAEVVSIGKLAMDIKGLIWIKLQSRVTA